MNQYNSNYNGGEIDLRKYRPMIIGVILIIVGLVVVFKASVTIDSGHAGVLYRQFDGGVDPEESALSSGFHFIAPWNHVIEYEVRQKEITAQGMEVLSSNLLTIKLDLTVFYEPDPSRLGYLEIQRGQNYAEVVIRPIIRSVTREVVAKYLPEEINTTKREQMEIEIEELIRVKFAEKLHPFERYLNS